MHIFLVSVRLRFSRLGRRLSPPRVPLERVIYRRVSAAIKINNLFAARGNRIVMFCFGSESTAAKMKRRVEERRKMCRRRLRYY